MSECPSRLATYDAAQRRTTCDICGRPAVQWWCPRVSTAWGVAYVIPSHQHQQIAVPATRPTLP